MINHERTGSWKSWYENGNIKWTGEYINGLPNNEWAYFYDFGLISKKCEWEKGILKKWIKYLHYDENGYKAKITFDNDINQELFIEITKIDKYISQQELELIKTDLEAEGLEVNSTTIRNYFRIFVYYFEPKIAYYSNLEKVIKLDSLRTMLIIDLLKVKEIDFTYRVRDTLDQVLIQVISQKNEPLNVIIFEYFSHTPNKLFSQKIYKDSILQENRYNFIDNQTYNVKFYSSIGKIHHTGHIKEGNKHGTWKYFDKSGNLIKKEKYKLGIIKK